MPDNSLSPTQKQSPSPTFCILPWIHVSTKTNGEVRLCCTTCASSASHKVTNDLSEKLGVNRGDDGHPVNLNTTGLLEAWNSEYMKRVRRQMLSGERPAECQKCFREEDHGLKSKRIWETQKWSQTVDTQKLIAETTSDGSVPERILYFDLRFGHLCNLKCTMCSPHDSSSWIQDWEKITPQIESDDLRNMMGWDQRGLADGASYDWHRNPNFWMDFEKQIENVKQLYFAGGEPLLIEEHYRALQIAIDSGRASEIELRYNSNGTVLPERALNLWKSFKKVRFGLSLDGIGETNKYIRYPASWRAIETNLRKLDETPDHIEVTLACAVQILNIFHLPEFIQWKLDQNFKKINSWPNSAGLLNFHLVYHPAFLNIRALPRALKEKATASLLGFRDELLRTRQTDLKFLQHPDGIKRIEALVNFMNGEDWSNRWKEFKEFITLIERVRPVKLKSAVPLLWNAAESSGFPIYELPLADEHKSIVVS